MTNKQYDASDPEQVEAARKKAELKREQELADVKALLSHPFGRRFLNRLFNQCNMYSSVFTGNSKTYFNDGARSVGLSVLGDIAELNQKGDLSSDILVKVLLNNLEEA